VLATGVALASLNTAPTTPGTPTTWGNNTYGQLGNGPDNNNNSNSAAPVAVSTFGFNGAKVIAGGANHSLALQKTRTGVVAKAWGHGISGQLGNGTYGHFNRVPVQVSNLSGFTAIAAGGEHSLALYSY